jgi:hypothetical protein
MLVTLLIAGYCVHRAFFARDTQEAPASSASRSPAQAPPLARLCGQAGWPQARVGGGAYVVQNDGPRMHNHRRKSAVLRGQLVDLRTGRW